MDQIQNAALTQTQLDGNLTPEPYIYGFKHVLDQKLNLIKTVNLIAQYWRCLFFININIFCHCNLEIESAIPV